MSFLGWGLQQLLLYLAREVAASSTADEKARLFVFTFILLLLLVYSCTPILAGARKIVARFLHPEGVYILAGSPGTHPPTD